MIWQVVLWLIIFAVCLIVEILTLGLTTIWFAGGALITIIVAMCTDSLAIQVLIFSVVSLILLFTTRPIAKKYFNRKMEKTNVESLIGRHVVVTNDIDNLKSQGQIKMNGLEWTARSADNNPIPAGCEVEVVEVSGVKLIVKQIH
ncbi:MAG: NfeD family protein [Coprococcus sp.]